MSKIYKVGWQETQERVDIIAHRGWKQSAQNPFGKISLFLFRASTSWMKSTHIVKNNLTYSEPADLNVYLINKSPYKNLDWPNICCIKLTFTPFCLIASEKQDGVTSSSTGIIWENLVRVLLLKPGLIPKYVLSMCHLYLHQYTRAISFIKFNYVNFLRWSSKICTFQQKQF